MQRARQRDMRVRSANAGDLDGDASGAGRLRGSPARASFAGHRPVTRSCRSTMPARAQRRRAAEDRAMTFPHAFEEHLPSTSDVAELFADEISALGGTLVDVFDDGDRLLARALFADTEDVTPGDTIRGGIAIQVRGA